MCSVYIKKIIAKIVVKEEQGTVKIKRDRESAAQCQWKVREGEIFWKWMKRDKQGASSRMSKIKKIKGMKWFGMKLKQEDARRTILEICMRMLMMCGGMKQKWML